MVGAFTIWLGYAIPGAALASSLPIAALAVSAAFALWGCVGESR